MKRTLPSGVLCEALNVLGQPSKRALLYQLRGSGISVEENCASNISIEHLQSALNGILGASGASMIMNIVFAKMDKQYSQS